MEHDKWYFLVSSWPHHSHTPTAQQALLHMPHWTSSYSLLPYCLDLQVSSPSLVGRHQMAWLEIGKKTETCGWRNDWVVKQSGKKRPIWEPRYRSKTCLGWGSLFTLPLQDRVEFGAQWLKMLEMKWKGIDFLKLCWTMQWWTWGITPCQLSGAFSWKMVKVDIKNLSSNVVCSLVSSAHQSHARTGKHVVCLKASGLCKQSQNNCIYYEFNWDLHNLPFQMQPEMTALNIFLFCLFYIL